jgi:hypothetical protein
MIEVVAPQDAAGTPGAGLPRDCLACGFRTARLSLGGCCSSRCAEFLAAGGLPKSEQARHDDPFLLHPECIGPVGQLRGCDGCGLTFESRGLRLLGELMLHQHSGAIRCNKVEPEAEASYRRALQVARDQSAKSWELRAAMSLVRLLQKQDRREETRAVLAPTYEWFTEGLDTRDLSEARALLEILR